MNNTPNRHRFQQNREITLVPDQAVGLVALPDDRKVWWTGRVAIGLRYNLSADARGGLSNDASKLAPGIAA